MPGSKGSSLAQLGAQQGGGREAGNFNDYENDRNFKSREHNVSASEATCVSGFPYQSKSGAWLSLV